MNAQNKVNKTNQVGVRLTDSQNERLEGWMEKYKKADKATIFRELLEHYGDLYEAAEEAKLDKVYQQTGKKADASHKVVGVEKRKAS